MVLQLSSWCCGAWPSSPASSWWLRWWPLEAGRRGGASSCGATTGASRQVAGLPLQIVTTHDSLHPPKVLCNYIRTASLCCAACCFLHIRLWAGPKAFQELCSTSILCSYLQSYLGVSIQTADLDEEADDTLDLETIELINLVRAAVAVQALCPGSTSAGTCPVVPGAPSNTIAGCLDRTMLLVWQS